MGLIGYGVRLFIVVALLSSCGGGSGGSSGSAGTPAPPTAGTGSGGGGGSGNAGGGTGGAGTTAYDLAAMGVPKFVTVNYIDLSKITHVSRFRSSAGHDYWDSVERCRSMKHYFATPDQTTTIYSPVAGTIAKIDQEWAGMQVRIRSDAYPAFTFVIFHLALGSQYKVGDKVTAGQVLGTHIGTQTSSDIAVEIDDKSGYRLVSYFDTLTDAAFAPFKARGISSPSQFVISREERDASPLTCNGETFTSSDPLARWVAI